MGGFAICRPEELREKQHISHMALAMALNMNQNTISRRYETGAQKAAYDSLIALVAFFDVSIDYLPERTDNPKMNR